MGDQNNYRNRLAFWLFGMCNNFAFTLMLASSKDILSKDKTSQSQLNSTGVIHHENCIVDLSDYSCSVMSTGAVLICNIVPALFIQFTFPIFINKVPYSIRHSGICFTQAIGLFLAASADSVTVALLAVIFGSASMGFGEMTYLAFASRYPKSCISYYAAGTGAAGIIASLTYACFTGILGFSTRFTLMIMMVVPVIFFLTYLVVLQKTSPVIAVSESVVKYMENGESEKNTIEEKIVEKEMTKKKVVVKILPYLLTVSTTYFGSYFTSQGLAELVFFTCDKGLGLSPAEQFRWYQVVYQVGSFVAKTSGNLFTLPKFALFSLPVSLLLLCSLLLVSSFIPFLPHVTIAMAIMCFTGFANGVSYVNTCKHVHKSIPFSHREFALTIVAPGSMIGILAAALAAMPTHNAICEFQKAP